MTKPETNNFFLVDTNCEGNLRRITPLLEVYGRVELYGSPATAYRHMPDSDPAKGSGMVINAMLMTTADNRETQAELMDLQRRTSRLQPGIILAGLALTELEPNMHAWSVLGDTPSGNVLLPTWLYNQYGPPQLETQTTKTGLTVIEGGLAA
jgi:hypothetical protein